MFDLKISKNEAQLAAERKRLLDSALECYERLKKFVDDFDSLLDETFLVGNDSPIADEIAKLINGLSSENRTRLSDIPSLYDERTQAMALKILYIGKLLSENPISDKTDLYRVFRNSSEIGLVNIEIFERICPEEFKSWKVMSEELFDEHLRNENVTSVRPYLAEEEKEAFNRIKRDYNSNNMEKIFESVEAANRDFFPFEPDLINDLIFNMVVYPCDDLDIVVKKLSEVRDVFYINWFLSARTDLFDLHLKMIGSDNPGIVAVGISGLEGFLVEKENGFYRYVMDEFYEIEKKEIADAVKRFLPERDEIKKLFEDHIKSAISSAFSLTNYSGRDILVSNFLSMYVGIRFRHRTAPAGFLFLIGLQDVLHGALISAIAEHLKSKPEYLNHIIGACPPGENTVRFYAWLSLNVSKMSGREDVISKIAKIFFENFMAKVDSDESNLHFGFSYDYQIDFREALLAMIDYDTSVRKDKGYYFEHCMKIIERYVSKSTDPFCGETVSGFYKTRNILYLLTIAIDIAALHSAKTRPLGEPEKECLKTVIDALIPIAEGEEHGYDYSFIFWRILFNLARQDTSFTEYYMGKVNSIPRALPLMEADQEIPESVLDEKEVSFFLKSSKEHIILQTYWQLYKRAGMEGILEKFYEYIPERVRSEFDRIGIHKIRTSKEETSLDEIMYVFIESTRRERFVFNHISFLSYWTEKQADNRENADALKMLGVLFNYGFEPLEETE